MFWGLGELASLPWALFIPSNNAKKKMKSVLATEQNFLFGFYCVVLFDYIYWMRKNNMAKFFRVVSALPMPSTRALPWHTHCAGGISKTSEPRQITPTNSWWHEATAFGMKFKFCHTYHLEYRWSVVWRTPPDQKNQYTVIV